MFCRQVQHSIESAHHFSSRPDCNNTAEVHSFTLRTALSAVPFVSICVVSTYNDSRKDLHKLCQIPKNCQSKKKLGLLFGSKNFCKLLSVSWKFLFCTDTTGSIERLDPAPRLHIDDCFEIHPPRWELCDLLSSNHQNFLHEARLCQHVFCTGLLWFWSSGRSRNFGLSASEF